MPRSRTSACGSRAELQELVANGLSTMVVQAQAVPRAVEAGDRERAAVALAAVETTGREALTEMRTLLGVLRREDDGLTLAPQPGLARLEALAERTRDRGLDVSLELHGGRRALPAGVDLTAYRVSRTRSTPPSNRARTTPRCACATGLASCSFRSPTTERAAIPGSSRGSAIASASTAATCARSGRVRASACGPTFPWRRSLRDRLRGLSERDWRTLDRVFVAGLVVIETIDLATTSELEGPLA